MGKSGPPDLSSRELGADRDHLLFILDVFRILRDADLMGESTPLIWRALGDRLELNMLCSDMFAWACADCEEITPDDVPLLRRTLADLRALNDHSEVWLGELFAARKREMRPMNAWFRARAKAGDLSDAERELFEAAGPERESTWLAP